REFVAWARARAPQGFRAAPSPRGPLEFMSFGAHSSPQVYGGAPMPLTGPVPGGKTFFCQLRSTLFGDPFAASQERKQRRKMRRWPSDHGQVRFDESSGLQACPAA